MRCFEVYLRECIEKGQIDFSIRARITDCPGTESEPGVAFYIHPTGKDGDTIDCIAQGHRVFTKIDTGTDVSRVDGSKG